MTRRFLLSLFLAFALIAPSAQAEVPHADAEAFVVDLAENGLGLLTDENKSVAEKRDLVESIVREKFAVEVIASFALGRYRRQVSDEQFEEYTGVLIDYLLATWFGQLVDVSNVNLSVAGVDDGPNAHALVNTNFDRPGESPLRVTWWLKTVEDEIRITDIRAEGASLTLTTQEQIVSLMRREGYDGLLKTLRDKIEEAEAKRAAEDAAEETTSG